MKYSTTILLLIGAISIEESQAIELGKKQSHFEEVFGQIEKNPSGKKHKKHHGHHGQHGKHKKKSHSSGSNASGSQEGQASSAPAPAA